MRERTGWRGHKERDKAKKKYSRQENQISTRELVSILTYWLSLVKKAPSADFKVTFTILIVYGGAVPFPSLRNYPLVFFILGNQFKPFTFFNLAGNTAYFLLERYMEQTHAYTHMHTKKNPFMLLLQRWLWCPILTLCSNAHTNTAALKNTDGLWRYVCLGLYLVVYCGWQCINVEKEKWKTGNKHLARYF